MKPRKKMHVLLVDDEPIILSTVGAALLQAGYDVTAAGSSAEAAAHLQNRRPDVVVTDISMEGMDGRELLRQARALDPDVAVIIITGYCDVGSAIEILRLGADDFLSKPFDFDELLLRVARCAQTRELRRKVRLYEALLPVCPLCRKVRDDRGREREDGVWLSAEEWLSQGSAKTLCPSCASEVGSG